MAVTKVETDIITSITASLKGKAVKLVKMYVETFKNWNCFNWLHHIKFNVTLTNNKCFVMSIINFSSFGESYA